MELKIVSNAGDEVMFGNIPCQSLQRYSMIGANPIVASAGFGQAMMQHFPGNGFDIWYSVYGIAHPVTLIGRADLPVLELHIPFKNTVEHDWDGITHTQMREHQFDLSFTPHVNNEVHFRREGEYHTFDIHYHKETLQQFAPYFPQLAIFLEKVEKKEPASLVGQTRFITADMLRIINQVLHFEFAPALAPAYYESKAMELLIIMLNHISIGPVNKGGLSSMMIEKAYAAKDLILSSLSYQFSASELAVKTVTNVYTLKTSFRQLFGCSLFQYGTNARMDQAYQLLREGQHTVSEIAWLSGYQDVQNFSIAFKKHFHTNPEKVKGHY